MILIQENEMFASCPALHIVAMWMNLFHVYRVSCITLVCVCSITSIIGILAVKAARTVQLQVHLPNEEKCFTSKYSVHRRGRAGEI